MSEVQIQCKRTCIPKEGHTALDGLLACAISRPSTPQYKQASCLQLEFTRYSESSAWL